MADVERRCVGGEIRAADGEKRLRGYAIVFHKLSEDLGGFRERILPEAVARTIKEGSDVRALIDHDSSKVLGRVRAGTLRLDTDRHGLRVDIDPPDTTAARDLLESVKRGDITGMSFGFRALDDQWRTEEGEPVREVSDMELFEVSIVSFPAYPQTSVDVTVAQRALREFQAAQRQSRLGWLQRWHRIKTI
jgi:hypothetical protein